MISKSMAITLTPMITAIAGMIAQSNPQFSWITSEMIFALLGMFGISAGVGAKVKNDKRKADLEEAKQILMYRQEPKVDKPQPVGYRQEVPSPNEQPATSRYESQSLNNMTPLEKERFEQSGGIVDLFKKSETGIRWNNSGHSWYDTDFDHDPEKGNVVRYGALYLHVKVSDAVYGHTCLIKNEAGKVMVADQKPKNQISAIRLANRQGPFPVGKYTLMTTAMGSGTSYTNSIEDDFYIV